MEIGKTVNEVKNETQENVVQNTVISEEPKIVAPVVSKNKTENKTDTQTKKEEVKEEKPKEEVLAFSFPVQGDVMREYAKDNLIYSETLKEWVTHLGIDIKAEKTTVVKSAEKGTVQTIKNDPRLGLTITIEHANNFKTIYSNLLTTEFVVEGETVEKGQTLGTVGNTAVFEILDEPHLHFEMLKDGVYVDPTIYLK